MKQTTSKQWNQHMEAHETTNGNKTKNENATENNN